MTNKWMYYIFENIFNCARALSIYTSWQGEKKLLDEQDSQIQNKICRAEN